MSEVAVYDHRRPVDADLPDGVYRVVGVDDDVTLLRVGDADGRRVNTGEVLTVDREAFDQFDSAANPDGNRSLAVVLAGVPETIYWQLRAFAGSLAASPIVAAVGIALVLVGAFGDHWLPADTVGGGLIIVGALVLALVGSGRL